MPVVECLGKPWPPAPHAALLSAGFDWRLSSSLTMTARVDTEFSGNTSAANGTARLRFTF